MNQPMIFLGWDPKIENKGWFIKLDVTGQPVVDWFNSVSLDYVKTYTGKPELPKGLQIVYGKYVTQTRSGVYENNISDETKSKFGKYLAELIEKYKEKVSEQK